MNPYAGAGATYYLLDTVEALYRQAEGTVEDSGTDADIDFTDNGGVAGLDAEGIPRAAAQQAPQCLGRSEDRVDPAP